MSTGSKVGAGVAEGGTGNAVDEGWAFIAAVTSGVACPHAETKIIKIKKTSVATLFILILLFI
jgi:hypothetical protein